MVQNCDIFKGNFFILKNFQWNHFQWRLCLTFTSNWSVLAVTITIFDSIQSQGGTLMGRSDPVCTKILGDGRAIGETWGAWRCFLVLFRCSCWVFFPFVVFRSWCGCDCACALWDRCIGRFWRSGQWFLVFDSSFFCIFGRVNFGQHTLKPCPKTVKSQIRKVCTTSLDKAVFKGTVIRNEMICILRVFMSI